MNTASHTKEEIIEEVMKAYDKVDVAGVPERLRDVFRLELAAALYESDYDLGWRYVEAITSATVESKDSDSGKPLGGTSAFRTYGQVVDYTRWTKHGYIVLIGGVYGGNGEMPGEIIICDAVALAVMEL